MMGLKNKNELNFFMMQTMFTKSLGTTLVLSGYFASWKTKVAYE